MNLTNFRAQGNILITLDDQPATYALLERIRSVIQKDLKISKDILLFGQIIHADSSSSNSDLNPMIKIIAGDPGKGSIALSGGYRVQESDQIQLFYEDTESDVLTQNRAETSSTGVQIFFSNMGIDTSDSYEASTVPSTPDTMQSLEEGLFTGASNSGVIAGTQTRTWVEESVGSCIYVD